MPRTSSTMASPPGGLLLAWLAFTLLVKSPGPTTPVLPAMPAIDPAAYGMRD